MFAEPAFEGLRKLLHERRREAKTQQEETARETEQQQHMQKRDEVVRGMQRQTAQAEKRVGFGRFRRARKPRSRRDNREDDRDETVDDARQEEEKRRARRERKQRGSSSGSSTQLTLMNQDTMAAGEPHEPVKVATWRNLMVPRGPAVVRWRTRRERQPRLRQETPRAQSVREEAESRRHNGKNGVRGGAEALATNGLRRKDNGTNGNRRQNKITLKTWEVLHAATTKQAEWYMSPAAAPHTTWQSLTQRQRRRQAARQARRRQ